LAEQGQLDYDMRIADVWPEFAQHGKGDVTLRHALTHSAGVLARLQDRNWSAALELLSANIRNFDQVVPPGVRTDASLANRRDILRADIPATGTVSARAIAKMYAALMGEVDGVRMVSPQRLREISAVAMQGPNWAFGHEGPKTLGYAVKAGGAMFGWGGSGGSLAGAAPEHGLALAATKNSLAFGGGDPMEDLRTLIPEAVA
jgi:CubicO group peptidase (beta-lactamase class C family)